MTRTSTALKRLGVSGLAVATIGAGIPAFFATAAQASHTGNATRVEITPEADSAAAGTCNLFRINTFGNTSTSTNNTTPAEGTVVDVVLTERDEDGVATASPSATEDVDFCTASTTNPNPATPTATTGSTTPAAPANGTDSGPAGTTDRGEFTTDANGIAYFGIVSNEDGTVDIQAFLDQDNDNTRDPVEPQDFAVKFFTPGGNENVNCVDADPENDTNVVGEQHTVLVRLTNNITTNTTTGVETPGGNTPNSGTATCAGDPVSGVTPTAVVETTSTANSGTPALTCTASDNNGVARCTYTRTVATNDTIRAFVNQQEGQNSTFEGGNTTSGEPSDVVNKSYIAAQTARTVDITCTAESNVTGSPENTQTSAEDCVNQTNDQTRVFTATVDNGTVAEDTTGTLVRFTISGGSGDEFLSVTDCTTVDAAGDTSTCSTTVTDPTPRSGDVLTVTATIRGTSASDAGTLRFRNTASDARYIELTPATVTLAPEAVQEFIATVTDIDGRPVEGVTVTFTENGAGFFRQGDNTVETDANGRARIELTSSRLETGSNTVTATIAGNATECEEAAGKGTTPQGGTAPAGATAGQCSDTSTVTFTNASPTATPTATTTPGPDCTGIRSNLPVRFNAASARVSRTGATGPVVNATALVTVTVTGATPNRTVELEAYQQNHFGTANFANAGNTRTATADANGVATFQVRFSSNARARAKMQGCAFGANAGFNQGNNGAASNVLYVRTVITFTVTRVGTRTIRIVGDSIPARPGGLIVNIHCTDARCKSASNPNGILFQPRANAVTGEFGPVTYTFASVFQNNRVTLYAATGRQDTGEGDAQNVAGRSNNRSVLIF